MTTCSLLHELLTNDELMKSGGAKQDRTADLLRARQALSQLSYSPLYIYKSCTSSISLSLQFV